MNKIQKKKKFYHAEDKTNLYYGHIGLRGKTGFGVKGLQMEFTDL